MIYFTSGDQHLVILEPANILKIKEGELIRSPDNEVAFCYTPDLPWFQKKLKKLVGTDGSLDVEAFDRLRKESLKRTEVVDRARHPLIKQEFKQ